MKKGSSARKCVRCNRIVFWSVPDGNPILGLVQMCTVKKVLDHRFIKENPDGSGHYYCMDCLKQMFPDKY